LEEFISKQECNDVRMRQLEDVIREKDNVIAQMSHSTHVMMEDHHVFDEAERMDSLEREAVLLKERDDARVKAAFLQDSLDEHQSAIEDKLTETEEKLSRMQSNRINNNAGDLASFQDTSLIKEFPAQQQSVEFLQLQLAELAEEQE
jgi:hypothetical protein